MSSEEKQDTKHFGRYLNWSIMVVNLTVSVAELIKYYNTTDDPNFENTVIEDWPSRRSYVLGAICCSAISLFLALFVWIFHLFPVMKKKYITLGKEMVIGFLIAGQVSYVAYVALRALHEIAVRRVYGTTLVVIYNSNLFFSLWCCILSVGSLVGSILNHYATLTEDINIPSAKHNSEWMFLIFIGVLLCILCIETRVVVCRDIDNTYFADGVDADSYCKRTTFGLIVGIASISISTFAASMGSRGLVESFHNVWTSLPFCALFTALLVVVTHPNGPANAVNDMFFVSWIGLFVSFSILVTSIREMRMAKFVHTKEEDHLTYDGDDASIVSK